MDVLKSQAQAKSETFRANAAYHRSLAAELRERLAQIREGGGERYRQRHLDQGKMLARERIDALLDEGGPLPGAIAAGRLGLLRRRCAGRWPHHRHRPHPWARVRAHRQRRDGERAAHIFRSQSRNTCARNRLR